MQPVRRATVDDAAACAGIVRSWLDATPWLSTPPSLQTVQESLVGGISMYDVWVAGDPVAGYLSFDPETQLIRGFYCGVSGRGTGKRLLDHVKTKARRLQLWTHAPNTRAHAFYLREGFHFSGDRREGSDGPDEVHMHWQLTQGTHT